MRNCGYLDGTDFSPPLLVWVIEEEVEADHKEELYTLHVLNLLIGGQWRVKGMERKPSLRPKWNTRWQEVGRRPLKLTPGLCAGTASLIDSGRDGREGSQVPPEAPQTTQIYNGRGGEWSRLGPSPTALCLIIVQTARVSWLHPNNQANTDNSLEHKLHRQDPHMKTLERVSTGDWCQICG